MRNIGEPKRNQLSQLHPTKEHCTHQLHPTKEHCSHQLHPTKERCLFFLYRCQVCLIDHFAVSSASECTS